MSTGGSAYLIPLNEYIGFPNELCKIDPWNLPKEAATVGFDILGSWVGADWVNPKKVSRNIE